MQFLSVPFRHNVEQPDIASVPVLSRTSTVADAYRQINVTIGNRTVLQEGYYYLNNFNNILSSFGMKAVFHLPLIITNKHFLFICLFSYNVMHHEAQKFWKHNLLTISCFLLVTLFELTVVNNWYITMVSNLIHWDA